MGCQAKGLILQDSPALAQDCRDNHAFRANLSCVGLAIALQFGPL